MALTVSPIQNTDASPRRLVRVLIGVAGDYSSGITLDQAALGMSRPVAGVAVLGSDVAAIFIYDTSTSKLRAYKTGAALSGLLVEVAGADVAGKTLIAEIFEGA